MADYFYSDVCNTNTQILKPYSDSVGNRHPYVDLEVGKNQSIYSLAPASVVYVNEYVKHKFVAVFKISHNAYFTYQNLDSIKFEFGDDVDYGMEVGSASNYVQVGYLTRQITDMPLRLAYLGGLVYYVDPMELITTGFSVATDLDIDNYMFSSELVEDSNNPYYLTEIRGLFDRGE